MRNPALDYAEKNKILQYSRKKFHSEGFYKTSMDELSRGLGISKKTIYKHFRSKDELIEQICASTSDHISSTIDGIVDAKTDVVVKFVKILNLYSNFTINISRNWLRDLRIHTPGEAAKIDERRRTKTNDILKKLIHQGKKEKLIENYPTPVIINTFTATIVSIMNPEFLLNNRLSVNQAFRETYNFLLNGMLTVKGKKKLKSTKALLSKDIEI